MKHLLAALALSFATLLTAACGDGPPDSTGDSNTENQQTKEPAPVTTQ